MKQNEPDTDARVLLVADEIATDFRFMVQGLGLMV
jgi:hypothetical protein